jgi:hypothetical protein
VTIASSSELPEIIREVRGRRPSLIHVEETRAKPGGFGKNTQVPTPEDLTDGIGRLTEEVHAALDSDRWAILDTGPDHVKWLLYDQASLRHCCRLLNEMEIAAQAAQEFAARLLYRAHLEAWLVGLYIHYGGFDAVTRIAQDTRYHLEAANNDAANFDKWLKGEKKAARARARRAEEANKVIRRWNDVHPNLPPKPLMVVPHVPQLRPSGIDLTDRITDFGNVDARSLPVSEVVDILTRLAPEKGFGRESFRPLYLIYWVLSSITHPTLNVYDSYFLPTGFIRTAPAPVNGSIGDNARITALHATAFLACAVLGDQGCPTPVADELRTRLAPDPSGRSAWAPGI